MTMQVEPTSHDGLVDLKVRRTAAQSLNIDTPFSGVEFESLKGTFLAEEFDLVNVLVTTIVPRTRITLGVFVGHG